MIWHEISEGECHQAEMAGSKHYVTVFFTSGPGLASGDFWIAQSQIGMLTLRDSEWRSLEDAKRRALVLDDILSHVKDPEVGDPVELEKPAVELAVSTAQRMARKRDHDWACEENFLSVTFGKEHKFRDPDLDIFHEWSCFIEVEKRPLAGGRHTVKMRPTHGSSKFETYELTTEEIEDVLDAAAVPMALRPECCGD